MLVFKKIRWRNLLSTGNSWSEISLDGSPNNLIIGDNGSGKSTILDAITFALFGKPFRKIKKGQLVNSINAKDCKVEIEFEVGKKKFKVIRGIKPDVFEIWANAVCLNQNSESKDYQLYLEKFILGMNLKTFTQIVIAGAASYLPFMQLSAADRRAFIEDLLDIRVFSSMSAIMKTRAAENKTEIEKNKIETTGKRQQKDLVQKNIDLLQQDNKEKISQLEEIIIKTKDAQIKNAGDLAATNVLRNDALELCKDQKKVRVKHDKMLGMRAKIEANKDTFEQHQKFFIDHSNCPVCKQQINDQFKDEELTRLDGKIGEYQQGLSDLDQTIYDLRQKLDEFDKQQQVINQYDRDIARYEAEKHNLSRVLEKTEKEIEVLSKSNTLIDTNNTDLNQVTNELKALEDGLQLLIDEKTLITTASDLLKDGGIKTKIIKKYLPIINKTINKYLQAMGFLVHFQLDETFNETIKARYRDEFSYESFSEGEKMRIDLALLFTWRAIAKMKNSANTNLLILDEVFDGSLDNAGIDEFLKIMWGFTKDTNTFIISHKQDQMIDKFKKVYKAVKKKNFSYLEVV